MFHFNFKGMKAKYLFLLLVLLIAGSSTWAQYNRKAQVTRAEYFFDTDPGAGLGTSLLAADGSINDAMEKVFKNGILLSAGKHLLGIRVKDSLDWGPVFYTVISVENALLTHKPAQIMQGEVFWDTDPGQGSGTAMIAYDGSFNDALETVIKYGLNQPVPGKHLLGIRVKDGSNNWGPVFSTVVSVENNMFPANIKIALGEMFWDTDPGVGSGTPLLAFDGSYNNALEVVFRSGILLPATGIHKLNVRVKDGSNNWSPVFTTTVSVEPNIFPRLSKITAGEFFWDTDPGQGSGTALLAFDGSFNDALETVFKSQTVGISTGIHKLCIRVKDAAN
jgi:hypothetical protein